MTVRISDLSNVRMKRSIRWLRLDCERTLIYNLATDEVVEFCSDFASDVWEIVAKMNSENKIIQVAKKELAATHELKEEIDADILRCIKTFKRMGLLEEY